MRISEVAMEIEQESTQVTAVQSMGPVCRVNHDDAWPVMHHQCQSDQVWEQDEYRTSNSDQNV